MSRPKHFLDRKEVIAACNLKNNLKLKELIGSGQFFQPCGRYGNAHLWCADLVNEWSKMYHQNGFYPTKTDLEDIYLNNLIEKTCT